MAADDLNVRLKVEAEASKAVAGLEQAATAVAGVGQAAEQAGGQFDALGQGLAAGGQFDTFFDSITKAFRQLDQEAEAAAQGVQQAWATLGAKDHGTVKAELEQLAQAYRTLKNSGTASLKDLERAKEAYLTKVGELRTRTTSAVDEINQAWATLGAKSQAQVTSELKELAAAYRAVAGSGTASAKDVERAWAGYLSKVKQLRGETQSALDGLEGAWATLGATSLSQYKSDLTALGRAYRELANSGTLSASELERAQDALKLRIQQLKEEYHSLGNQAAHTASRTEDLFAVLGRKSFAQHKSEIKAATAAYKELAASGELSARELAQAQDALRNKIKQLKADFRGAGAAAEAASPHLESFASRLLAIGGAYLGLHEVWQALKKLTSSIINVASGTEAWLTQLDRLTGGKGAAKLRELKDLAFDLGVDMDQLTQAWVSFANTGLILTNQELETLIDGFKALRLPEQQIQSVITQLGQMSNLGKASMDELRSVAEAGIPVFAILEEQLGLTKEELANLGSTGLQAGEAMDALLAGMEARYAGVARESTHTWESMLANLKNFAKEYAVLAGEAGFFDYVKRELDQLLSTFKEMQQSGELERFASATSEMLTALGHVAELLVTIIQLLSKAVIGLAEGFDSLRGKVGAFVDKLGPLGPVLVNIARWTDETEDSTDRVAKAMEHATTAAEGAAEGMEGYGEAAKYSSEEAKKAASEGVKAARALASAFKDQGVTSVKEYQKALQEALDDYIRVRDAATTTEREKAAMLKKVAELYREIMKLADAPVIFDNLVIPKEVEDRAKSTVNSLQDAMDVLNMRSTADITRSAQEMIVAWRKIATSSTESKDVQKEALRQVAREMLQIAKDYPELWKKLQNQVPKQIKSEMLIQVKDGEVKLARKTLRDLKHSVYEGVVTKFEVDGVDHIPTYKKALKDLQQQGAQGVVTKFEVQGEDKLAGYQQTVKELENKKPTMRVEADTRRAEAALKEVKEEAAELPLQVTTDGVETALQDVQDLVAQGVDVPLVPSFEGFEAALAELETPQLGVSVIPDVEALGAALEDLDPGQIVVQVLVEASEAFQVKATLQETTYSDHYINVYKLEANAHGGIVGLAGGGKVRFPRPSEPVVRQGSGTTDDVPALLMRGEFVLKQAAVRKYGLPYLYALNEMQVPPVEAQTVPKLATGGLVVPDLALSVVPRFAGGGRVSGSSYKSISDSSSSHYVEADTTAAKSAIGELEKDTSSTHTVEYKTSGGGNLGDKHKTKADVYANNNFWSEEATTYGGGAWWEGLQYDSQSGSLTGWATGGLVQAFANGGVAFPRLDDPLITRGSGVKDDVPALLKRGEFVLRQEAVNALGVPYLHSLNQLSAPPLEVQAVPKLATGGLVLPELALSVVPRFAGGGYINEGSRFSASGLLAEYGALEWEQIMEMASAYVEDVAANINLPMLQSLPHEYLGQALGIVTDTITAFDLAATDDFLGSASTVTTATNDATQELEAKKTALRSEYKDLINLEKQRGNDEIASMLEYQLLELEYVIESLQILLEDMAVTYRETVEGYARDAEQEMEDIYHEFNKEQDAIINRFSGNYGNALDGADVMSAGDFFAKQLRHEREQDLMWLIRDRDRDVQHVQQSAGSSIKSETRGFEREMRQTYKESLIEGKQLDTTGQIELQDVYNEYIYNIQELEIAFAAALRELENEMSVLNISGFKHWLAAGGPVGFARGGKVPHFSWATEGKDSVPALLTPGEFVMRREAVHVIGEGALQQLNSANDRLAGQLLANQPQVQRFNSGGLVPGAGQTQSAPASGGQLPAGDWGTLTLSVGGEQHQVLAEREVAQALRRVLAKQAKVSR